MRSPQSRNRVRGIETSTVCQYHPQSAEEGFDDDGFLSHHLFASSSTAQLISISGQPPPSATRISLTDCESTGRASWNKRSASSITWFVESRSTIVQASRCDTREFDQRKHQREFHGERYIVFTDHDLLDQLATTELQEIRTC
jgi:hypothetical protein